ncbi:MAG: hypothetical protein ABIS14_09920 [Sphingomonas sp.]
MAFEIEVIVDVGVDRGELLYDRHPPEPEHCLLSTSEGQVAVLNSVDGSASDLAYWHCQARSYW